MTLAPKSDETGKKMLNTRFVGKKDFFRILFDTILSLKYQNLARNNSFVLQKILDFARKIEYYFEILFKFDIY